MQKSAIDYIRFFESMPVVCCIMTPDCRIIAANDAYLAAGEKTRDELIGKVIYEVFPDSPTNRQSKGANNLKTSLKKVLKTKKPDNLGVLRYDIELPKEKGGGYGERWWRIINFPVLDDKGNVIYLVNWVDDVNEVYDAVSEIQAQAKKPRKAAY